MSQSLSSQIETLRRHIEADPQSMLREPTEHLPHPFMTPGSEMYSELLFDWDSWLCNVALRQILMNRNDEELKEKTRPYERGCVLNFLHYARKFGATGYIPIWISGREGLSNWPPEVEKRGVHATNMHKPCLAQHAAFLVRADHGDAEWLRESLPYLHYFLNNYRNHHRHDCGLYFWQDDFGIGVDNDPCTLGRPPRSSGSIYLNSLMYRELQGMAYVLERLALNEAAEEFRRDAEDLRQAIQQHCWDERDGFFYSVDFALEPPRRGEWVTHAGFFRDWPCLIQRIGVWSGFMGLWSGVATEEQAQRMAEEHYRNERTFGAAYGVRTLSKMEKMYSIRVSNNPSSWLGPVWGIANYMTFRGFVRYGLQTDAKNLAEKTIRLFARDLERFGALHEYYQPDNGEPLLNRHFANWNYLVLNMAEWLEGHDVVAEF